jgi:hypothetical protein
MHWIWEDLGGTRKVQTAEKYPIVIHEAEAVEVSSYNLCK